jgi:ADP-ribosylglycohydrolase
MSHSLDRKDRVLGALLGGAVGDALGAPVEFLSISEVRLRFGPNGIQEFAPAYGRMGAITDDTQMTLFTAEGVIRAQIRWESKGICYPPGIIHRSLLRWLYTQGERSPLVDGPSEDWLMKQKELFAWRAPGNTCLSALRAATRLGDEAQNDSKGCGAIMRIAPIGLVAKLDRVYEIAAASARTTHGHVASTISSGFFALVIAHLAHGAPLEHAIDAALATTGAEPGFEQVGSAVEAARGLACSASELTPEALEGLGPGWVAEEALAVALCCALRAESFEHGIRLAANHSGDSDSTARLTGQLLGTAGGPSIIPERWLRQLELREVIETIATDLAICSGRADRLSERYWG